MLRCTCSWLSVQPLLLKRCFSQMTSMRAWQAFAYGGADQLQLSHTSVVSSVSSIQVGQLCCTTLKISHQMFIKVPSMNNFTW